MFGYVTPCKMELKIKDYEKVKAYYCGLCRAIKYNYGNFPRLALNYDMTFLAIFLDSFNEYEPKYIKNSCILHPIKKRIFIIENTSLDYAAFLNTALSYYKLVDNIKDDNSLKSKALSLPMKKYLRKVPSELKGTEILIKKKLDELYTLEENNNLDNLDALSHSFGELIGEIILSFWKDKNDKNRIYNLGYNLGKWIYIIDAFDDLEKDMKDNKFNAINSVLNKTNIPYNEFVGSVKGRIEFILTSYARECAEDLAHLTIRKNEEILFNIFNYGLLEKIDSVFSKKEENR